MFIKKEEKLKMFIKNLKYKGGYFMKILEIVFGNSCYMTMKNSSLRSNDILLCNLLLNVGDLSKVEEYKIDLCGKHVVILGRSNIVGKPLVQCCLNNNATVTVCHSKTKEIENVTKDADVLISAIGKPRFVTADMIKDGVVVIDVGINRLDTGEIVGDIDFESVSKKASYITPVPGGVGPMTIAMLLNNVVKAAMLFETDSKNTNV